MLDGLGGRIAAVLDGGACPVGLESTIVGFEGGAPVLLRPGGLPVEAIEAALGRPVGAPARRRGITAPGPARVALRAARRRCGSTREAPAPGEVWLGFGPGAPARRR